MKNIVNIINFVRGIEPRPKYSHIDLLKPIREQLRLMRELKLTGTFLLQYDAMLDQRFVDLVSTGKDFCEIGLWLEIVQPQVEAIGEEWHGRYPWDWFNDVGFLIGYEPQVRLRLIDEAMSKFLETFGKYPESVGSWHIDAYSMKYIAEKYQVSACCICRDQVGTDGYTMQGGYYNQAYYPSVHNMFCPANSAETQINMPVFRMLGSDPIYAYDYQLKRYGTMKIPTLEPVWAALQEKPWISWFLDELFDDTGLACQYTHAGQENSFGWEKMKAGIEEQFPLIRQMVDEGRVEVLTLGESGRWFKEQYALTPAATVTGLTDWLANQRKSVWYYNRFFRTNLFWDDGIVRIRDLYRFDDRYEEHFLHKRCTTNACEFRNLPIMDGTVYSGEEFAGLYLTDGKKPIRWENLTYTENGNSVTIWLTKEGARAVMTLDETGICIEANVKDFCLTLVCDKTKVFGTAEGADQFTKQTNETSLSFVTRAEVRGNTAEFTFDGYDYSVTVAKGRLNSDFSVFADQGIIKIEF